ncbi:MAG TPA: RDD family protein [Candidatus Limnocylindrales bacterium]|nr:RDD family protein [Candidatus Limnocylindrales bacterium]
MTSVTMPAAASTEKASWTTRFLAALIDFIGLAIVGGIISSITGGGGTGTGLQTLIGVAYFCYFWSAQGKGQTLGMKALNIKVVKTDGTQLDLVGAFIRYIGLVVSIACLFIGVIWAAFDAQKQGWHDKIASTYVVKA